MICCSFSMEMYTQSYTKTKVIETTVDLNPSEYQLIKDDWSPYTPEVSYIKPTRDSRYSFVEKGNVGEPDIPWVAVVLPVDKKENFVSFTYTIEETSVRDTFLVAPIDALVAVDMGDGEEEDYILVEYPDEVYPQKQVMYISTIESTLFHEVKKSIVLHVCPFRYDAKKKILQLLKVHLKVTVNYPQTMLEEGDVWTYRYVGYNQTVAEKPMCGLAFDKFYINGSHMIEGHEYHEIWMQHFTVYSPVPVFEDDANHFRVDTVNQVSEPEYFLSLREEDGRVFAHVAEVNSRIGVVGEQINTPLDELFSSEGNEYIVYDFNNPVEKVNFYTGEVIPFVGGVSHLVINPYVNASMGITWSSHLNLFARRGIIEYQDPDFMHDPFFPDVNPITFPYRPFIEEGKTWTYEVSNPNSSSEYYAEWTKTYQLDGDTLINSYRCTKVYATSTEPNWEYNKRYIGALFEDGGKVYIFWQKSQTPHLLYDFSCKEGDIVVIDNRELIIQEKLRISYGVNSLNIYLWSYKGFYGYQSLWVEGIGCPDNNLLDFAHDSDPGGYQHKLLSCSVKGTEIFNYDTFQKEIVSITSPYRPFIEMGKVWRTGINPGDGLRQQYEYRFYGDSIVGGKTCKVLGKSELEILSGGSYRTKDTTYVAALYESGQKVYLANPDKQEFILLYDFASPVGTDITVLSVPLTITRREKSQEPEFKGMVTELQSTRYEDAVLFWLEGVGSWGNPLESLAGIYPTGVFDETPITNSVGDEILISCAVGDELIYLLQNELDSPYEVKKHWLDFTHTTKPRPKSPKLAAGGETDADKAAEQETLTGEYSAKELFVSLKTLAGTYTITLKDNSGNEVYRKEVQTSNVVALNTDLTKYAEGTYTLTVENSEEQYTATLSLPLIDDAVRDLQDHQSVNGKSVNSKWLDLSGRRLTTSPTRKGVYIKDGRKVLVK